MQDLLFLLLLGIGFSFWSSKAGDYHECTRKLLAMPVANLCDNSSVLNDTRVVTKYIPYVYTPAPHPVVKFGGNSYHDYESKSDSQKTALMVYQHPRQLPPLPIGLGHVTWTVFILLQIFLIGFKLLHRHDSHSQQQKVPQSTEWKPLMMAHERAQDSPSESGEEVVEKVEEAGCKACASSQTSLGLHLDNYFAMKSKLDREISALKQENSILKVRVHGLRARINPVVRQNIARKCDLARKDGELARLRGRVELMEMPVRNVEIQSDLANVSSGGGLIADSQAVGEEAWAELLGGVGEVGGATPELGLSSHLTGQNSEGGDEKKKKKRRRPLGFEVDWNA